MSDIIRFNSIAGVPIRYARKDGTVPPAPPYGTLGTTVRHVSCRADFRDKIAAFLADLARACPYGPPSALVCGSFMGGRKSGQHAEGRAWDLDAVWWGEHGGPVVTYYADQDARRYLAVEATLRRHFGVVLNWWTPNLDGSFSHKCHFHCDSKYPTGFYKSRTIVRFVQLALTYVLGRPVAVDGEWGPQTAGAAGDWKWTHIPGVRITGTLADNWITFLGAVEEAGWW